MRDRDFDSVGGEFLVQFRQLRQDHQFVAAEGREDHRAIFAVVGFEIRPVHGRSERHIRERGFDPFGRTRFGERFLFDRRGGRRREFGGFLRVAPNRFEQERRRRVVFFQFVPRFGVMVQLIEISAREFAEEVRLAGTHDLRAVVQSALHNRAVAGFDAGVVRPQDLLVDGAGVSAQ